MCNNFYLGGFFFPILSEKDIYCLCDGSDSESSESESEEEIIFTRKKAIVKKKK